MSETEVLTVENPIPSRVRGWVFVTGIVLSTSATTAAAVAVNEYTNAVNTQLSVIRKSNYETTQKLQAQLTSTTAARNAYIKRLRKSAASSNSSQATNTGSSSTRESDQASFDLFLNLLDRHTRELVEVGEYADKLKAAGLMCEQSHDPLTQLQIN